MQFERIGFRVFAKGREIAAIRCDTSIVKIGRLRSAHLVLDDPSVSRLHAIVETHPPAIIDLGSTTGTFVNDAQVTKRALAAGDRVRIGVFTLVVASVAELAEGTWRAPPVELAADRVRTPAPAPVPDPLAFLRSLEIPRAVAPPATPRPASGLPAELAYLEALAGTAGTAPLAATPDPNRADADEPFAMILDPAQRAAMMELLARASPEDAAFADHVGLFVTFAIDKLREHRGKPDEAGTAYATIVECLGVMRIPRAAPSLLIELSYELPKRDAARHAMYAATIAHNDLTWPHLFALADLPGFARPCAAAAVAAGRDPAPWLAHPFHEVRTTAARMIRDPDERQRACASLPPSDDLVDGLFSACADHRAWTIDRVANRRDPADAIALAVADELDAARAAWGWPRTRVDWTRWPGVPTDDAERARWLRAEVRARPDAVPTLVHAQLAYAPRTYAPPRLELTEDAHEALLDNERCEALAALAELEAFGRRSNVAAS